MSGDPIGPLTPLARLAPLAGPAPLEQAQPAAGGFAGVLNQVLSGVQQANGAADAAIADLATGKAQDLHTVSIAVAQADVSFRLMLELRNRLTEAFQEVTRMQV